VLEKADASMLADKLLALGVFLDIIADYGDTSSFKFELPGLPIINIIVTYDDVDFEKWQYATDKMKLLPPIIDREERLNVFHKFQEEGFGIAMKKDGEKFYEEYKKTHGVQPFNLETGPPKVNSFNNPFNNFGDVDDMWK
jgi:hypothetical protein